LTVYYKNSGLAAELAPVICWIGTVAYPPDTRNLTPETPYSLPNCRSVVIIPMGNLRKSLEPLNKLTDGSMNYFSAFTQQNAVSIKVKKVIFLILGAEKFKNLSGSFRVDHGVSAGL